MGSSSVPCAIFEEEKNHGSYPQSVIAKYATTANVQMGIQTAVAMSLMPRREYISSLNCFAIAGKPW